MDEKIQTMEYQFIKCNIKGAIAHIQLNRPEKLNALCFQMMEELGHALSELDATNLNALFIYGNDKAFSSGGDLKEMKQVAKSEVEPRSQSIHNTFRLFQSLEIPTVAFISGICLGGGLEMSLHCDFRIATEDSKIGLPELKYGIIPGGGGTVQLPIQMGYGNAAYYLLTCENIPIPIALQNGIIQKIIPAGTLFDEIENMGNYFSNSSSSALRAIKKMLQLNRTSDIYTRYKNETALFEELLESNGREGIGDKF